MNLENENTQFNIHRVICRNIVKDMCVQDREGKNGVIRNCDDLHNVHVTFEGEGIEIDWYGTPFVCGGSGLYCFVENCEYNCENQDPLYYTIPTNKQTFIDLVNMNNISPVYKRIARLKRYKKFYKLKSKLFVKYMKVKRTLLRWIKNLNT